MLDQLLGSRCLQPNAVFVSAIYSTIYMKNGKVVYQITRESLNVVLSFERFPREREIFNWFHW